VSAPRLSLAAAAALLVATTAACTTGSGRRNCHVIYSGNYEDLATAVDGCTSFSTSSAPVPGHELFELHSAVAGTSAGVNLTVQLDLGVAPAPGDYSPAKVAHWRAIGVAPSTGCRFVAGDTIAPNGDFRLRLLSIASADGHPVAAHGTLHLEQSVHAPEKVDCGPGSRETVDADF